VAANQTAPILIRAAITPEEWRELRAVALAENKSVQDLLAELIRQRLNEALAE